MKKINLFKKNKNQQENFSSYRKTIECSFFNKVNKYNSDSIILSNDIYMPIENNLVKNLNTFILGRAGSGKSRFFIRPNILQANTSLIINDVGGFLLREHGNFLKENGYKIKYLNLHNKRKSMKYNPFKYIFNDLDIYSMVDCIIDNTFGIEIKNKNKKEYFHMSEKALLGAFINYFVKNIPKNEQTLKKLKEMIINFNKESFDSLENLDISFYELLEESIEYWQMDDFKRLCSSTIIDDVLESIIERLSIFDDKYTQPLMLEDEFELEKLGFEKIALFIIPETMSIKYMGISSMFMNQVIDMFIRNGEEENKKTPNFTFPFHTRFIFDDFPSIGKIPKLGNRIPLINKYNASINILIQTLNQIKDLYKDESIDGTFRENLILKSCDIFIFAGSSNFEDIEYACSRLPGYLRISCNLHSPNAKPSSKSATIVKEIIYKKVFGVIVKEIIEFNIDYGVHDYLQRIYLDYCVVSIGEHAFVTKRYELKEHPNYETCGEVNYNYFEFE